MATMAFNKYLSEELFAYIDSLLELQDLDTDKEYLETLEDKLGIALFDSRCFSIPKEEVTNCFIWRQQDATRNAIQMLGQTCFSHKELDCKDQNDIQDMLMLQKGINFNDMPIEFKRGVCCIKNGAQNVVDINQTVTVVEKPHWVIDKEIPIFTQDRNYIEQWI
jgi:tRNA(His) 5'-end guanylyltransferase